MRIDLPMARRLVFAAATALALGFGAQQAMAAPAEGSAPPACKQCRSQCPEFGGQLLASGQCACCG